MTASWQWSRHRFRHLSASGESLLLVTIATAQQQPQSTTLNSLAPLFEERRHKLYLSRVLEALANPNVRNIAVAGAYGAGKSSVLQEVTRRLGDRVVSVSLSTVGALPNDGSPDDGLRAADTMTNRIQKEIVKQLLYQAAVGATPESRFRRLTPFQWDRNVVAPAIGATIVAAVAFLGFIWSGSLDAVPALIARTALVALAVGAVALVVLRLLRKGSVSISSVTAGPATVSLSKDSTSFFDDYLDEIIYRFLACKWDVVMFEDIDRFENVEIFESLRSLNTLLNGAVRAQHGRAGTEPIRFVYALRDSVFERLGRAAESQGPDRQDPSSHQGGTSQIDATIAELARANRTKFFDVVIPMVPFITYRNARELMKLELQGTGVSDGLIDLVAKYVAEMRLIKNSRNELEVFSEQLLKTTSPLPGLTADRLYALILYKSFHMADFERIRTGQSALDSLFSASREVVSDSILALQDRRGALHEGVTSEERAKMLGDRLRYVLAAFRLTQVAGGDIDSPEFWRDTPQLGYRERSGNTGTLQHDQLCAVLDVDLDPSRWDLSSAETRDRELRRIDENLSTLAHATWADLFARPDFTTKDNSSFASICASLDSQLAIDLVQHGFITEYFALDIAPVYGQMVDPRTYNYMIHFVDRGSSDLHYALTPSGVEAILRDYGHDVLRDRSMQNLTVMDYLLAQSPEDARLMTEDLLRTDDSGQRFFMNYLESGARKLEFVRLLAPRSTKIYSMLVDLAKHSDPGDRTDTLLNTALALGSEEVEYELPSRLRNWIETHYKSLPSFVAGSAPPSDTSGAMAIAARAGVKFADVAPLSSAARELAVEFRSYLITADNLVVLIGRNGITLDSLAENSDVFDYVVSNVAEYLAATSSTPGAREVIENLETLVKTLNGLSDASALDALLQRTRPEVVIDDLTTVPTDLWPTLAASHRARANLSNVSRYRTEHGIDASLSSLLGWAREISDVSPDEQTERAALAQDLVRAGTELPDAQLRVSLALSLSPGELDPNIVGTETGPLVGLLLEEGLLPDAVETFGRPNMRDWATFADAVHRSTKFADFMSPDLVPSDIVARLLSDTQVPLPVKQTVVDNLSAYASTANEHELAAIVQTVSNQGYAVRAEQLMYLATRNADPESLIQILPACDLDINGLLAFLAELPPPYALLAGALNETVRLPGDPAHESLVQRLKAEGLARSRRGSGRIDVYPPNSAR
jgi:hypothetical protein